MVFNLQIDCADGINICIPVPLVRFRYLLGWGGVGGQKCFLAEGLAFYAKEEFSFIAAY